MTIEIKGGLGMMLKMAGINPDDVVRQGEEMMQLLRDYSARQERIERKLDILLGKADNTLSLERRDYDPNIGA